MAATGFSSWEEIAINGFPTTGHSEVGRADVNLTGNGLHVEVLCARAPGIIPERKKPQRNRG